MGALQLLTRVLVLGSSLLWQAKAQDNLRPYAFTTLAGRPPSIGSADGETNKARFNNPNGITIDSTGNLFVADVDNHTIRKINTNGTVTTFAGKAGLSGSTDGTGAGARFNLPTDLITDTNGNLWIADSGNNCIRKLTPDGAVTTWVGQPGVTGSSDGVGSAARFSGPKGIALDQAGNFYVTDFTNCTIRKITPDGAVSTIAGKAGVPGLDNSSGLSSRFRNPRGIRVGKNGLIYVGDYGNGVLRRISTNGGVRVMAGGSFSLPPQSALGVVLDDNGYVYFTDFSGNRIMLLSLDGTVTTLAGYFSRYGGSRRGSLDGPGAEATLDGPAGICQDRQSGYLYFTDANNNTVRKVSPEGSVTTFAGSPLRGKVDGAGSDALFDNPTTIASDRHGGFYLSDGNNGLRQIAADGTVSSVTAYQQYSTNGPFYPTSPYASALALGDLGNLYVASSSLHVIQRIDSEFKMTTFAGQYYAPGYVDGDKTTAKFNGPQGVVVDSDSVIYVADTGNHSIRKVTPDGVTTTIAGAAGVAKSGYADGRGTNALFRLPYGICVDTNHNLYVADTGNSAIRKITPDGEVTTFAGVSLTWGNIDEVGTKARFSKPNGIAIDSQGNLYVTDSVTQTIRKITPSAVVTTIGGLAGKAGQADGIGSNARFNAPAGLCVDSAGKLVILDAGNRLIRQGAIATITTPVIQSQPQSLELYPGQTAVFQVGAFSVLPLAYQWLLNDFDVPGATNSTLVVTNVRAEQAGQYAVALSNDRGIVLSDPAQLTLRKSPELSLANAVRSNSAVRFQLPSYLGNGGFIQASHDLAHWTNVASLSSTNITLFDMRPGTNLPAQYYRLKINP